MAHSDGRLPSAYAGAGHPRIPEWDGGHSTWQRWLDEIRLWRLGESLAVPYSLAARLISGLSGVARRYALQLTAEQLFPEHFLLDEAGADAAGFPAAPRFDYRAMNAAGIDNLVEFLRVKLQPQPIIHKTSLMNEFFGSRKHFRRAGQSFPAFNAFYDETIQRLGEVGIVLPDDVAGWMYLRAAGLSGERRERVISCLPDAHMPFEDIRRHCLRLFPDIHVNERSTSSAPRQAYVAEAQSQSWHSTANPSSASGSSTSASTHSGRGGYSTYSSPPPAIYTSQNTYSPPWDASSSTYDDGWQDDGAAAAAQDDEEFDVQEVQACLNSELQALADDLIDEEELLDDAAQATLERAATTISEACEALGTVRSTRNNIRAKGGKGRGRARRPPASGKGKTKGSRHLAPTRGKQGSASAPGRIGGRGGGGRSVSASILARKAKTTCNTCGRVGHWVGDPECPGRMIDLPPTGRGAMMVENGQFALGYGQPTLGYGQPALGPGQSSIGYSSSSDAPAI